ncbi:MAG: PepSY-like domain-containing protein [Muribaculaceae bacterium]|nr:PepSY-like domain-containing protein [Muribaculaceae bacterium]MDE7080071.1 PepSY-like domain-containing protein [Muribaculaceae bacterium]
MKKTLKIFSLLLLVLVGTSLSACDNDDDDVIVPTDQLPTAASTFINTYYPSIKVAYVNKDTDKGEVQYEVRMTSGDEITFDASGEWIDVDAPDGRTIPDGIAIQPISDYVEANYTGAGINEISRTASGYEVELTNGVDLRFDPAGNFMTQSY